MAEVMVVQLLPTMVTLVVAIVLDSLAVSWHSQLAGVPLLADRLALDT